VVFVLWCARASQLLGLRAGIEGLFVFR